MLLQPPAPAHPVLNRDLLERCTVSFYRKGWATLPDIRLVEVAGRRWVVKDWSRRSLLRRLLQGRFMIKREYFFLRHLEGIEGVPRSEGFPDADSLAIEHFEGRNASVVYPQDYPRGFFDDLEALVRAVHLRGVAHGDLDQDDNVMVRADGSPGIIDFGNALRDSWYTEVGVGRAERFHGFDGLPRSLLPWVLSPWRALIGIWHDLLVRHDLQCVNRLRGRFEIDPINPSPQPPPDLLPWQRKVLVFFRKMERNEPVRVHGVGEAP